MDLLLLDEFMTPVTETGEFCKILDAFRVPYLYKCKDGEEWREVYVKDALVFRQHKESQECEAAIVFDKRKGFDITLGFTLYGCDIKRADVVLFCEQYHRRVLLERYELEKQPERVG